MHFYVFRGKGIGEGIVEGEAIVTSQMVSPDYINPLNGEYVEPGHELRGKTIKKKILVCLGVKGSSVITHKLYVCCINNNAPLGLIVRDINAPMVHSVLLCKIPVIYGLTEEMMKLFQTGDYVSLDAGKGVVRLLAHVCHLKDNF